MRKAINERIRTFVAERANFRCEYCRLHSDYLFLSFEIDHVIAVKHGGTNNLDNLAYACPHCNQHKGSDFATLLDDFRNIILLFNPRIHDWNTHFETLHGEIIAKTQIGEASVKIFQFNNPDLLIIRQILSESDLYP